MYGSLTPKASPLLVSWTRHFRLVVIVRLPMEALWAQCGIKPHRMNPPGLPSPATTVNTSWVGDTLYADSSVCQSPSNSEPLFKLSQVRY